jgi:threonyl-tRNA synthetase
MAAKKSAKQAGKEAEPKASGKIKLSFPDKTEQEFPRGTKAEEIVKEKFKKELAAKVLGAKINSRPIDLSLPVEESGEFDILTFETDAGLDMFRHSSSHVMSLAVKRLHPGVKVAIGPNIDDGFYYDFDNLKINDEDLLKIEEEIKKVIQEKLTFTRREINKEEGLKIFKDEPYKIELLRELPAGEKITTYKLGEFEDLCRGPHVPSTGIIGAIKLIKLAGAYWRGDSKNKMLTRIYGISFPEKKMMEDYLAKLEEAKKRDHRRLGQDMNLFMFHDYSPGSPFFHHKGTIIYNELLKFVREEYVKRGYQEVITPLLYDKALWETSGHWEHFREDMFILNVDGREFVLKPMNCPSHCLMYKSSLRSYRELPLRIADFAPLHRNELKGVLGGLTRVRKFSQDDAHIFCDMDQIESEVDALIDFTKFIFTDVFKMAYRFELSTMPDKAMGSKEVWEIAEKALESALKKNNLAYKINPEAGAFYGPKIDLKVKDSLDREWQCATIQLDFNLPERFDLEYEGKDGRRHRPVMIHRALLGSLERFIGVMLEHFAGKLPLWINPVHVKILPIADRHMEYAKKIVDEMVASGLRVEIDERSETVSKKVRDAQVEKVNYILVVGDREAQNNSVNVRTRNNEVLGEKKVSDLVKELLLEIKERTIK